MAPQSGHVSNFRRPVDPLIEPVGAHCFQTDRCEALTRVHAGYPVWTRLELTKGAQCNIRMARDSGAILKRLP